MNAYELVEKVKKEFENRPEFTLTFNSNGHGGYYTSLRTRKTNYGRFTFLEYITIDPVYRHNGTAEDVTAVIKVYELREGFDDVLGWVTKVPKNASDKVIAKRVTNTLSHF